MSAGQQVRGRCGSKGPAERESSVYDGLSKRPPRLPCSPRLDRPLCCGLGLAWSPVCESQSESTARVAQGSCLSLGWGCGCPREGGSPFPGEHTLHSWG